MEKVREVMVMLRQQGDGGDGEVAKAMAEEATAKEAAMRMTATAVVATTVVATATVATATVERRRRTGDGDSGGARFPTKHK